MSKFLWKIGGEAGFGIMTTGLSFSKICTRSGYNIFDYIQYPSLVRGGHNGYEVIVADDDVHALKNQIDYLVCLNKETFDLNKDRLNKESCVIYDNEEFSIEGDWQKINIPFNKILKDLKGQPVMKNTIALAGSLALLGGELSILFQLIEEQFGKKGKEIVDFNKRFAEAGFNYVKDNYAKDIKRLLTKRNNETQLVITGNDAFSLASVVSDCRLYCAYPMTPSSSVLTVLAGWQKKTGMVVRHAEDEISVINTALGGSFMGTRSSVGTSAGGYALMTEAVSLAGITETPIVIFVSQRPGPATGMPTWTEQGDLLFIVHSGHGEFPKIVLAPGNQEEMLELTLKAFNLADIYQTPVLILSDMYLSESHKSVSKTKAELLFKDYKVNRGKLTQEVNGKYLRYKITDDGVSERLIPGTKGAYYQANSYEHLEDSHTTEDGLMRKKQVDKRNLKSKTYFKNDFQLPKIYGNLEKAETVFVSWGSTLGILLEAQKILKEKGKETAIMHFRYIYPLDEEKIKPLFTGSKHYVLVENNSQGQFGKLLRQETGIEIKDKILKYDGRQFNINELI